MDLDRRATEVSEDVGQGIPDLSAEIGIASGSEVEFLSLLSPSIGQLIHEIQKAWLGGDAGFHAVILPFSSPRRRASSGTG